MKRTLSAYAAGTEPSVFWKMFAVSSALHVIFFAVLTLLQDRRVPEKPYFPAVVQVEMVAAPEASEPLETPESRPASEAAAAESLPDAAAEAAPAPETVPDAAAPETVSLGPPQKLKPKTSLKKKTFTPVPDAVPDKSQTPRKPDAEGADRLKQTLDRLARKVAEQSSAKAPAPGTGPAGPATVPGQKLLALIDIYRVEVAYQVQRNWAFSGQLAGTDRELQASLVFKVMPDGEIRDVFFTDRSGNRHLDDSALKAVLKSNPVAPHPAGLNRPYINVGLRFTPKGVQ